MNQEVVNPFLPRGGVQSFDAVRLSIASPEKILSWSFGEIKKPETINYRTFKPERGGLFCARIFGPVRDYECLCGKYKRMKYKGVTCEKCGVEVTLAKIRRERMGHIDLAAPVAHIWFLKSAPTRIGLMLDMMLKDLEKVLYFEQFIVTEPGLTPLARKQLLTEEEYTDLQEEYGADAFSAGIGAEAVREMLDEIDLEELRDDLREEFTECKSDLKKKKIVKRLRLTEDFISSGNHPAWMIMTVLPVIPPDLRPLVPLEGGRFATSDLNDLYRRVINRNNRLKRLMELGAPDIIVRNEKRMLQEAVDALFDNGRRGQSIAGANKHPLKSLADMLKGKQGRFRQNLLGKRVDYSGRSVIVVGPDLKLHQCGLPKQMAVELFRPFIYSRLEAKGLATTVKHAKKLVEGGHGEVWDILDEVIREHPVLLNRAPTLHRLGIQAFEPILIEGKAIQLHPLVCTAFNADFDGDQMAVHVPLSVEAQLEARVLMMSTNNILHPANGNPIIVPSKDIVLGLYYMSLAKTGCKGEGGIFASMGEIEYALDSGDVELHSLIKARVESVNEKGEKTSQVMETTPGRMMLGEKLPLHVKVPFELVNRVMTKNEITEVVDAVYRSSGQKVTVLFCDHIMKLGFRMASKGGISFGKDDMLIPPEKEKLVHDANIAVGEYEQQYLNGQITRGEKYNKVVDAWARCTDRVADAMMKRISSISKEGKRDTLDNSIYMMAQSGARGSPQQMKQLAGMRGLMARPSGEIIEIPIISNFKEGLTVFEYFNSTHGARKGLADTALKTANSGYLTRRLVDVAQDCVIREVDCKTKASIFVQSYVDMGEIIYSLGDIALGRIMAEDVKDESSGAIIVPRGELVDEASAKAIMAANVSGLRMRSPLLCASRIGICAKCYGRDLARGTPVNIGEAVGIVAAQSIGEPGTQLTMRTFHIGGTAQVLDQSSYEASTDGVVKFDTVDVITDLAKKQVVLRRNVQLRLIDENNVERMAQRLPQGSHILVKNNQAVKKGEKLAEWDPYSVPIITEVKGIVTFEDLVEDVSVHETLDESTGISQRVVIDWRISSKGNTLKPAIVLKDKRGQVLTLPNGHEARYPLSVGAVLSVEEDAEMHSGDVLARIPTESARTRDITGGLPRVVELFEARVPKNHAVMAEVSGKIKFEKDYRNKRHLTIVPEDEDQESVEYLLPKDRHILVQDGDMVQKGEYLIDGHPSPHDVLTVMGIEGLARYLINEIQEVYRLQGVYINDKHIEVIIRQMLQKGIVEDPGDGSYLVGEQEERSVLEDINADLAKEKKKPIKYKHELLGITKASLHTNSFISAASFQETTRVLTQAATAGKVDNLMGLKENVIVGHLIPAGAGEFLRRLRQEADKRDKVIEDARQQSAQEKIEAEEKMLP